MAYQYSEKTYDVYKQENGALIAVCTDKDCNCSGTWVLQEAERIVNSQEY